MDDRLIRNYNRKLTTDNRYVIDSNSYWKEELHARVENLTGIKAKAQAVITQRITDNVWGFPVDEQSTPNAEKVLSSMLEDYLEFVKGRRVWVYTETNGYWTEERIEDVFSRAMVMAFWDIGNNLLIDNYPLVADDLRIRSGRTFSNDARENYHDSLNKARTGDEKKTSNENLNKLNTADKKYTQQDNTRNKIMEHTDATGSDTNNARSTSNTTNIQDTFLSPQNQGIKPSSQSASVMNRSEGFQTPDNMGVEEVSPNGNAGFTTATTNTFIGSTDTNEEGTTTTARTGHNRVDERDYVEGNETFTSEKEAHDNLFAYEMNNSDIEGHNNVGAKVGNETGHEREEKLDIADVLKSFYDLFKDRLALELDNRMYPYFLNMRIARFKDHRIGREHYE